MATVKSPYREVGVAARERKPVKKKSPSFCPKRGEAVSFGHFFVSRLSQGAAKTTMLCHYCGKPNFAVESKKCKGAR